MKLQQDQIWKKGDEYLRIVELERTAVKFKTLTEPAAAKGPSKRVSKKEFCRLIKDAELQSTK